LGLKRQECHQKNSHQINVQKTIKSRIAAKVGNMKKFIQKQIADIKKFSFAEMTSNSNGKTSSSGTMGVLIISVGTLCFLLGTVDKVFVNKDVDVITQSIIFVGMGVALLGYRKSKDGTETTTEDNQETNV
jgi:hypothetical protein